MSVRHYNYLPLRALVSFEAAARYDSFKIAAEKLNVTPAAISHQIKGLEQELRIALFRRHHRGVELTETGAFLLVAIQRGFEGISDALDQLRQRARQTSVTIQSTTAVSSLWLTPRLAKFWRAHSNISVSQVVDDKDRDGAFCDLSIHYGDMSAETDPCSVLFKERISVLCSPEFAERHPARGVSDLGSVPLIQLEKSLSQWTTWEQWASSLGYDGPLQISHSVNNYVIALQAALDGMGAILGWDGLTGEMVASGRLVRLLPDSIASPLDFYIAQHNSLSPNAEVVFDWLVNA